MFATLIVDDDVEMLKGLENLVSWETLGFTIVGRAENGRKALELVRAAAPDLLITDITMPSVDGLTLIRKSLEMRPALRTIILSCHEEFPFAHEAIALGVEDYLVKVTLTAEELVRALLKVRQKFEREKQILERGQASEGRQATQRLLRELLHSPDETGPEIADRLALVPGWRPPGIFRAVLLYLDDGPREAAGPFSAAGSEQVVLGALEEASWLSGGAPCVSLGPGAFLLICPERTEGSTTPLPERIRVFQRRLFARFRLQVSACVAAPSKSILDLKAAVAQAVSLRPSYYYLGRGSVIVERPALFGQTDIQDLYHELAEELRVVLLSRDEEAAAAFLRRLFRRVEKRETHPDEVRRLFRRLTSDLRSVANRFGLLLVGEPAEADTFDGCRTRYTEMVKEFFAYIEGARRRSARREIQVVLEHMQRHLGEAIHLDAMAALANLNSDYFSRLFKKETGLSFTDYLTGLRIERAKELLLGTQLSIEKIAWAVGLENSSYFYRMFKRHTGMTPTALREGSST